MYDEMGNRMKFLEGFEADRKFMPLLPVCCRLDGKCFHAYTKDMQKPYDDRMVATMSTVTKWLVAETGARIGYTQSDEISLVFYSDDYDSQIYFDGRIMKLTSVLAAMCSLRFYKLSIEFMPEKIQEDPIFDCRVWVVPTQMEAVNLLMWRESDCLKNSISSAASCYYSHHELDGKNSSERQELLFLKGINFNDYPSFFKRGCYFQRREVERTFTVQELEQLPLKHNARKNPDMKFRRHGVVALDMPPLSKVSNKVAVVFDGADPQAILSN